MRRMPVRLRRRDDRGATAVLVAIVAVVLFGAAALAVDYSSLAMERQQLHDNIDAAAHAGAFELPADGTAAVTQATALAQEMDPTLTPDVDMFCVVASKGTPPMVRTDQIPATCDPGPIVGEKCNSKICIIPCVPAHGDKCNAVRVTETKSVPYGFAKIIGFNNGTTGAVTSLACKGSCGNEQPNPLDVVIVADRTPSMPDGDREDMKKAILASLDTMDPSLHYVAFGTIHKSRTGGYSSPTCLSQDTPKSGNPSSKTTEPPYARAGTWLPVDFSDDYRTGPSLTRNNASALVKAVDCLPKGDGEHGTHLAAPLKAAARALLGYDGSKLDTMPARVGGPAKKVIILETDGRPEETINQAYAALTSEGDMGTFYMDSNAGQVGCQNFAKMAEEVKAKGITIITIGFGVAATGGRCNGSSGDKVADVLAKAASDDPAGGPSKASDCSSPSKRVAENADGDYFFCAATGPEIAPLFKVAIAQVSNSIRLMQIPS